MVEERGPARRTRRRRWPWALVALALATGGLVWLERDLPRRTVERGLAERLGARVSLGRLEIQGTRRFTLRGLRVRDVDSQPRVDLFRVERLDVTGEVGEILEGRFESLHFRSPRLRLAPARREPGGDGPPIDLRIGRLSVEGGVVAVEGRTERIEIPIEGSLTDIGGPVAGELRFGSEEVPLSPLLDLLGGADEGANGSRPAGRLTGLRGRLEVSDAGRTVRLEARTASALLSGEERRTGVTGPELVASVRSDERSGSLVVDARARLPGAGDAVVLARVDPDKGELLEGRADLVGLDLELLSGLAGTGPGRPRLEGRADVALRSLAADRVGYELELKQGRIRLDQPGDSHGAEGIELRASGEITISADPPAALGASLDVAGAARRWSVNAGEAVSASGEATFRLGGDWRPDRPEGAFRGRAELELPACTGSILGVPIPAAAAPLHLSVEGVARDRPLWTFSGRGHASGSLLGALEVSGAVPAGADGAPLQLDWTWSGVELAELGSLLPVAADLRQRVALRGAPRAEGTLVGSLTAPIVEGELRIDGLVVADPNGAESLSGAWQLGDGAAQARFRYRADEGEVELSTLTLDGALRVGPLEPTPASLHASARVGLSPPSVRLPGAALTIGELARVRLRGEWSDAASPPLRLDAELDGLELARWQRLLEPVVGTPFPGFSLVGSGSSEAVIERDKQGRWSAGGEARVSGTGFSSEDGSRVLEGLDTRWSFSGRSRADGAGFTLDASTPLGGFLLLWGTLFADYSERSGQLRVQLSLPGADAGEPPSAAAVWEARARLSLEAGAEASAILAPTAPGGVRYSAQLDVEDLSGAFERWVRAPLGDSVAALSRMTAGGSVSLVATGELSSRGRSVRGRALVEKGRLEGTQGSVFARGLELDLPLDLRWARDGAGQVNLVPGETRGGRVAFDRLGFGDVEIDRASTALTVTADSVELEGGLTVPLLGGVLGLEKLTLAEVLRPGRHLESGLRLSAVSLGELTRALDVVPLEGTLEGRFRRVHLSPTTFHAEGDGEFALLGGRVLVRDISGERLLSRFPKLTFSADFDSIDLGQLTRTFDFGEMNGVLQGQVEDCELFRWTPVRFRARVETVEREGVPRNITVKAINNIAILGTGGRVGVFDRGLHRFLDKYTYEKLGISMVLDQDVFLLRGLERRGDRELFLKGRLPFRIDVVNMQPGKSVSFRTMLDRLKSLDFGASAAEP